MCDISDIRTKSRRKKGSIKKKVQLKKGSIKKSIKNIENKEEV